MRFYRYVIVGAGPAGLQMGYFLEQAGREYVILEAQMAAGSFFTQQPRHRTLISFNKRYNWFEEPDFNLRYDWNSLLTYDNGIRFPDYSKDLYPPADAMVTYLNDFACRYDLNIQYGARVVSIDTEANGRRRRFVLTDQHGEEYGAKCLLMATGAVKPNIPQGIEGIDLAEGYETHDINPERFTNKRVLILGCGNSAFEVAQHLAAHAATIQIYTGGKLIKHAWQTHFVGDLRAINDTILEMHPIKMPHVVSGARITGIAQENDGTFRVRYEEDVPHWTVPGTMRSVSVYDYVIRATGWKYFEPSLFRAGIAPLADEKSKYPLVNSIWESTVPDLFFIGAAMAHNDRKTTSSFVHGFRYNIRTLFHLLERRYDSVPLPVRTFPLSTEEELETLVLAILTRVSTTSALFQMFGVLGDALVFGPSMVDWFPEMPMSYVLEQPEFTEQKDILTITLEFGFDRYPKDADALAFIHPNDRGDGRCVAFIHPVLRHYAQGKMMEELHLQSGVFVRYDRPNEEFAIEFDQQKPHHVIFNLVNRIAKVTGETLIVDTFADDELNRFVPWPPERRQDAGDLPECMITRRPGYVPDPEKYL